MEGHKFQKEEIASYNFLVSLLDEFKGEKNGGGLERDHILGEANGGED
jgi:hypothetical protein